MPLIGPDDAAILQAARAWLKGAGGGLTDEQVIPLDADGPRPAIPYLAVGVFADRPGTGGVSIPGVVDDLDGGGDPRRAITMRRAATVTVQAIIAPTGRVNSATATGSFAGTPVGNCAARAVRAARFPSFDGTAFRVVYPFSL